MKIPLITVSIQQNHPDRPYGQLATLRIQSSELAALVRGGIPADIPPNAIVTKADAVWHAGAAMTGSRTFAMALNESAFKVGQATWDNAPSYAGTAANETVGAIAKDEEFRIDLQADVQDFITGAETNFGWRLYSDEGAASRTLRGATSAANAPYLDLEYVEPGDAPADLHPSGGAVSIAKPVLTFVTADQITALNVQIDAAQDGVTPDFDSGTVAATAPTLDLAGTAYAGLSDGAETSWRVRTQSAAGWTGWSEWATFSRENKITVTITAPSSTSGDKTPTVTWTATGQESWRVIYRNAVSGAVLDDSGWETNGDHSWTPTKGLRTPGAEGETEVRVLDGVERVATPGDPDYAFDTQAFTLVEASAADGVDTLTATSPTDTPGVVLEWTGDPADEWQIKRGNTWLDRIDGDLTTWTDYTAVPNVSRTYKVLRVTAGVVSPNGPSAAVTFRPAGVWLMDSEDDDQRVMIANAEIAVSMIDQAVLHNVIGRAPVRRRVGQPPPSGSVEGTFVDGAAGLAVDFDEIAMTSFREAEQGHVFRLIWADKNIPVTIGDITSEPYQEGRQVLYGVSFLWWHTGSESWVD